MFPWDDPALDEAAARFVAAGRATPPEDRQALLAHFRAWIGASFAAPGPWRAGKFAIAFAVLLVLATAMTWESAFGAITAIAAVIALAGAGCWLQEVRLRRVWRRANPYSPPAAR